MQNLFEERKQIIEVKADVIGKEKKETSKDELFIEEE